MSRSLGAQKAAPSIMPGQWDCLGFQRPSVYSGVQPYCTNVQRRARARTCSHPRAATQRYVATSVHLANFLSDPSRVFTTIWYSAHRCQTVCNHKSPNPPFITHKMYREWHDWSTETLLSINNNGFWIKTQQKLSCAHRSQRRLNRSNLSSSYLLHTPCSCRVMIALTSKQTCSRDEKSTKQNVTRLHLLFGIVIIPKFRI